KRQADWLASAQGAFTSEVDRSAHFYQKRSPHNTFAQRTTNYFATSPAFRQGTLMGDQVQAAAGEASGSEWTWSKRSDVTAARWRMALSRGAGVSNSDWVSTAQPARRT